MTPKPASEIRKRSVSIAGHDTSLSLEEVFWKALKRRASTEGLSVNALVEKIDSERPLKQRRRNLSSAVRVYLFERAREGNET
ncbi:MAG: ribbon-helix-helix domain-containing protein [Rhodovibrionaceae bacterium]